MTAKTSRAVVVTGAVADPHQMAQQLILVNEDGTPWTPEGGGAEVGSTVGAALAASGAAGTSVQAARADHVHPFPTAANVAAVPVARTVNAKPLSANVVLNGADVVLTGMAAGTAVAVAATDTVNVAIAKLQAQITALP